MIILNPKTKGEVYGIREVVDLLHNGYFIMWSSGEQGNMRYHLKHHRNGRILTAVIQDTRFLLREGTRVLKDVPLAAQLISD